MQAETVVQAECFHCGQPCDETLWIADKPFCCYGCKTVFEILNENNLCEYYTLDPAKGVSLKNSTRNSYRYLDEEKIKKRILAFDSSDYAKICFHIPAIHCVSCIWLLENLQKIKEGVLRSEVNFSRKHVTIDFNPDRIAVSALAELLASLGYPPEITLEDAPSGKTTDRSLVLKLTVAGFCFGNVMLFSFPEYLGLDHNDKTLMRIFSFLNLALSVPVFFYSGLDYFRSSVKAFRLRQLNIDVPIAAGLLALFLRSSYDIVTATGPGYLDSFTGLVFFLLIGRWFQSKTYESLAFDRDFTSYFPLAVSCLVKGEWKPIIIYELSRGDQILIRNMEIIPADSALLDSEAYIDYSFVTGEAKPVKVKAADLVYAGGRLIGSPARLVVEKRISQSHLTSLWNNEAFKKLTESKYQKTIDKAARIFTWVVILIAAITAAYWQFYNPSQMWLVLTAVLMVACPCALALAAPFTYGSMLRVFGRNQLYLKNADVIERMGAIDAIVFDKTGTITHGNQPEVSFNGEIGQYELRAVKLLTSASSHPLSVIVSRSIHLKPAEEIFSFHEIPGRGIQGMISGQFYQVGSATFVGTHSIDNSGNSEVFVAVNYKVRGCFSIKIAVRKNMREMIQRLGRKCVALLSGDSNTDSAKMKSLFGPTTQLLFKQDPHDKLAFIKALQLKGKRVLMVGDGLNDSGALKQADVGIAVTDDTGVFTPACDAILTGQMLTSLDKYLELAKASSTILKTGFGISFFYNVVALTFAVTGHLTPLVAAILMPISSISVVGFSSLAVNWAAKRKLHTYK